MRARLFLPRACVNGGWWRVLRRTSEAPDSRESPLRGSLEVARLTDGDQSVHFGHHLGKPALKIRATFESLAEAV
jgi:hypothetical protein